FSATLDQVVEPGWFVTATATDPAGNTTAFSNCAVVTGASAPGQTGLRLISLEVVPASLPPLASTTPITSVATPADQTVPSPLDPSNKDQFFASIAGGLGVQTPLERTLPSGISQTDAAWTDELLSPMAQG